MVNLRFSETLCSPRLHAFLYATPDYEQNWALRILCGFTAGMLTAPAFQRVRRSERGIAFEPGGEDG